MGKLDNRVARLEAAAKPKTPMPQIFVTFVSTDGSGSAPFTYGEDGTLRPAARP